MNQTKQRWMMHIPVLNTGHVSQETYQRMTKEYPWGPCALYEEGGFFLVPVDLNALTDNPPSDLLLLWQWAQRRGYGWVRLDRDGDTYQGVLPLFEW